MKKLITLLTLTLSLGVFAQERVRLNSSEVNAPAASALLVRSSATPDKVEVRFNNIQVYANVCYERYVVPRTCVRNEDIYQTRRVCRDVVVTPTPAPGRPTGPRYNPPRQTRRECHNERYYAGTRQIRYDCSYTECRYRTEPAGFANDKVKIKFKNLPNLGGNEEETFLVTATQNGADNSNIVYSITPVSTINDRAYEVVKKGILGYDSYVIQPK